MKAMVIYDSVFGNTGLIAQAIGEALGSDGEVQTLQVASASPEEVTGQRLLVVGSPTRGFRATPATSKFLKAIPRSGLDGVQVAAFDTRFTERGIEEGPGILRFLVRLFGYAAEPIGKALEKKGGKLAVPPEGFYVTDTEGPLAEGELERAAAWARRVVAAL